VLQVAVRNSSSQPENDRKGTLIRHTRAGLAVSELPLPLGLLAPSTINVRLAAVRRLAYEASKWRLFGEGPVFRKNNNCR
jgi:hypothetical protein